MRLTVEISCRGSRGSESSEDRELTGDARTSRTRVRGGSMMVSYSSSSTTKLICCLRLAHRRTLFGRTDARCSAHGLPACEQRSVTRHRGGRSAADHNHTRNRRAHRSIHLHAQEDHRSDRYVGHRAADLPADHDHRGAALSPQQLVEIGVVEFCLDRVHYLDVALGWRDLLQPVGHDLCSGAHNGTWPKHALTSRSNGLPRTIVLMIG